MHALNLKDFHQHCHLVTADIDASTLRSFPELTHPIDEVGRRPDFKELRRYLYIPHLLHLDRHTIRCAIRGRGHLQHSADALEAVPAVSNHIISYSG